MRYIVALILVTRIGVTAFGSSIPAINIPPYGWSNAGLLSIGGRPSAYPDWTYSASGYGVVSGQTVDPTLSIPTSAGVPTATVMVADNGVTDNGPAWLALNTALANDGTSGHPHSVKVPGGNYGIKTKALFTASISNTSETYRIYGNGPAYLGGSNPTVLIITAAGYVGASCFTRHTGYPIQGGYSGSTIYNGAYSGQSTGFWNKLAGTWIQLYADNLSAALFANSTWYPNNFTTTLASGMASTDQSFTVTSASGIPPLSGWWAGSHLWLLVYDSTDYPGNPYADPAAEVIDCTGISGTTITCSRPNGGFQPWSATAQNHNTGGKTYSVIYSPWLQQDDSSASLTYFYQTLNHWAYVESVAVQGGGQSPGSGAAGIITLTLDSAMPWSAQNTVFTITQGNPVEVGYESMTIKAPLQTSGSPEQTGGNPLVQFSGSQYCWLYNVELENAFNYAVKFDGSVRCQVENCYIHNDQTFNPTSFGGGNSGYGVWLTSGANGCAGQCLVVNNFFNMCRHWVALENAGEGNVIAYNFACNDINGDTGNPQTTDFLMGSVLHGGNYWTLYEGNVCSLARSDAVLAPNPANTFFRNYYHRTSWPTVNVYDVGIDNQQYANYDAFVGNVVGDMNPGATGASASLFTWGGNSSTSTILDQYAFPPTPPVTGAAYEADSNYTANGTVYVDGLYSIPYGAIYWNSANSTHTLDNSEIYSSKPSWWDRGVWPAIGPDITAAVLGRNQSAIILPVQQGNPAMRRALALGIVPAF